jgi:hypothetical protein
LKLEVDIIYLRESEIVDGSIYAGINPPALLLFNPGTNNAYNNGTGYGLNLVSC